MRKYQLPGFLEQIISQKEYERWLHWRAIAHVKRDKKRGNEAATNEKYKMAIHQAVLESSGFDAYTKEWLAWDKISKYDNAESKSGGRDYKKGFALLPTVDHVGDGMGPANFKICAWQTNDAKSDLTYGELVELCKKVIKAAKESV